MNLLFIRLLLVQAQETEKETERNPVLVLGVGRVRLVRMGLSLLRSLRIKVRVRRLVPFSVNSS